MDTLRNGRCIRYLSARGGEAITAAGGGRRPLAELRRRFDRIEDRHGRRVARRQRAVDRCTAAVDRLRARLGRDRHSLEQARFELRAVRTVSAVLRGPTHQSSHRRESAVTLATVLAICVAVDAMVARAALDVIDSPLPPHPVLAPAVSVVLTSVAVGAARRFHDVRDGYHRVSTLDRALTACLVVAIVAPVGVAGVVLGATGGVGLGPAVAGGGIAAALVAALATYLHESMCVGVPAGTALRLRLGAGRAHRTEHRLRRAHAREHRASGALRAAAAAAVLAVDLVYLDEQLHLAGDEPLWVRRMRRWARGENLPSVAA
jgi:hypothetical protein